MQVPRHIDDATTRYLMLTPDQRASALPPFTGPQRASSLLAVRRRCPQTPSFRYRFRENCGMFNKFQIHVLNTLLDYLWDTPVGQETRRKTWEQDTAAQQSQKGGAAAAAAKMGAAPKKRKAGASSSIASASSLSSSSSSPSVSARASAQEPKTAPKKKVQRKGKKKKRVLPLGGLGAIFQTANAAGATSSSSASTSSRRLPPPEHGELTIIIHPLVFAYVLQVADRFSGGNAKYTGTCATEKLLRLYIQCNKMKCFWCPSLNQGFCRVCLNMARICLHMTRGPSAGCIPFHQNGSIMDVHRIPLTGDEEAVGGELVLVTATGVVIPPCRAGSLLWHHWETIHGVTRLVSGTRKSVLLVNDTGQVSKGPTLYINSTRVVQRFVAGWTPPPLLYRAWKILNAPDVIDVSGERTPLLLRGSFGATSSGSAASSTGESAASQTSEETTCKVCLDAPMTHAMVPCGHFCLCKTCVDVLASVDCYMWKCPICKTRVTQYLRVFL